MSLHWTRVARLYWDTTGSPATIPRLTGYWAASFSGNHCSTNPRSHPPSRHFHRRHHFRTFWTQSRISKSVPLVNPKKPLKVTLINAAAYSHASKLEDSKCFHLRILFPE